jgi:predicted amidohydrolase YtcJ
MSGHGPGERQAITRRAALKRGAVAMAGAATIGSPARALGLRRRAAVAELVLTGGPVITLDRAARNARAVAIAGGKVIAVGSEAEVKATIGPATEVIQLKGRAVMPGIHDGHAHPLSGGRLLTAPTLNYAILTLEQFVNRIRRLLERSASQEPDGWLAVSLWDASAMERIPTKTDLDQLQTQRPILVTAIDGHIALANSRALALAGIDASTPDPQGGKIRRGADGEPTGILLDSAVGLVSGLIPPPSPEQSADALAAAYALMAERGITSCLHASAREPELAALGVLADRGPLGMRTHVAIRVDEAAGADPATMLAQAEALRSTYGRPGVEIDNLKMFFDGVIEYPTQTAALLRPYLVNKGSEKDPDWVPGKSRGPTYWDPAVANAAIAAADAAGWQVHVHAIGDRAARSALDAFEAAIAANGRTDNRHTITHLELVDPADFKRFAKLGVLASMQMQWAERDTYTVDNLRDYLGPARYRNVYPSGSLREAGAMLCGGSDWPVDPLLPLRQVEMAVNRTADEVYEGYPKPLFAKQGIPRRASLAMHTANGAYQLHQEQLSGRIRPGMSADLIVTDRNPLETPLTKVSNTKVELTLLEGRATYRSSRI